MVTNENNGEKYTLLRMLGAFGLGVAAGVSVKNLTKRRTVSRKRLPSFGNRNVARSFIPLLTTRRSHMPPSQSLHRYKFYRREMYEVYKHMDWVKQVDKDLQAGREPSPPPPSNWAGKMVEKRIKELEEIVNSITLDEPFPTPDPASLGEGENLRQNADKHINQQALHLHNLAQKRDQLAAVIKEITEFRADVILTDKLANANLNDRRVSSFPFLAESLTRIRLDMYNFQRRLNINLSTAQKKQPDFENAHKTRQIAHERWKVLVRRYIQDAERRAAEAQRKARETDKVTRTDHDGLRPGPNTETDTGRGEPNGGAGRPDPGEGAGGRGERGGGRGEGGPNIINNGLLSIYNPDLGGSVDTRLIPASAQLRRPPANPPFKVPSGARVLLLALFPNNKSVVEITPRLSSGGRLNQIHLKSTNPPDSSYLLWTNNTEEIVEIHATAVDSSGRPSRFEEQQHAFEELMVVSWGADNPPMPNPNTRQSYDAVLIIARIDPAAEESPPQVIGTDACSIHATEKSEWIFGLGLFNGPVKTEFVARTIGGNGVTDFSDPIYTSTDWVLELTWRNVIDEPVEIIITASTRSQNKLKWYSTWLSNNLYVAGAGQVLNDSGVARTPYKVIFVAVDRAS